MTVIDGTDHDAPRFTEALRSATWGEHQRAETSPYIQALVAGAKLYLDAAGNRTVQVIATKESMVPVYDSVALPLRRLTAGSPVDYEGATGVNLIGGGEAAGSYRVYDIVDNAAHTLEYR